MTLATYVAKDALVPQLNNWGFMTVICAAAFAAPVVVCLQLGAMSLLRGRFERLRGSDSREHRPEPGKLVPAD